jgi:hypothetical protein
LGQQAQLVTLFKELGSASTACNLVQRTEDDTLFPTNWIKHSNIDLDNVTVETVNMFKDLDTLISEMIPNIVLLGSTLLVTNASSAWITCCLNVLPKFKQIVENNTISVTSARDLFSNEPVDNWFR